MLPGEDITQLLHSWKGGDGKSLDDLLSISYSKLHSIATSFLRRERPGHTLQATGLVHELYLVLLTRKSIDLESRDHFYSFAAYMMRLILRDWARNRLAQKRGGDAVRVPLSDDLHWVNADSEELLDLDRALTELDGLDHRKAELIQLKTFLGFSTEEAAASLGISKATADRDLRLAKAWLYERLHPEAIDPHS